MVYPYIVILEVLEELRKSVAWQLEGGQSFLVPLVDVFVFLCVFVFVCVCVCVCLCLVLSLCVWVRGWAGRGGACVHQKKAPPLLLADRYHHLPHAQYPLAFAAAHGTPRV